MNERMWAVKRVVGAWLRLLPPELRLAALVDVPEYREAVEVVPVCRCRGGDSPPMSPPETARGDSW